MARLDVPHALLENLRLSRVLWVPGDQVYNPHESMEIGRDHHGIHLPGALALRRS
jgi:hypothetical protein